MIDRTRERFGLKPQRLAGDSACGSAPMLAWLVKERQIAPHIPVCDTSRPVEGALRRTDFTFDTFDPARDRFTCPGGKLLIQHRRNCTIPRSGVTKDGTRLCRASKLDCERCHLKPRCCPNRPARTIPRHLHEDARDTARALYDTPAFEQSRRDRKTVERLFAHLKRILRLGRLRLRGPRGAPAVPPRCP